MTQQAATEGITGRASVYLSHSAVVTARMPTAQECAAGCRPGTPVLVVTGCAGQEERVYPGDWIAVVFGDPDGAPAVAEVAAAAEYVFDVITEELDNAGARLAALAHAARTSPGSVVRLAAEYRGERGADGFCLDAARAVKQQVEWTHVGQEGR